LQLLQPYLEKRVQELGLLSESELRKIGEKGKEKRDKVEEAAIKKIREKHWVK